MKGFSLFLAALCLLTIASHALVPPYTALHCPPNWIWRQEDDQCYRAFPTSEHNTSTKVRLTFDDATTFCDTQGAQLPILLNHSLADFLMDLVGRTSGEGFWIGIRKDKSDKQTHQVWMTRNRRVFDSYFDWDHRRQMPQDGDCVAIHMKGDPSKRINGGNDKWVTMSCDEPASVVCQKPRYPFHIGGVNRTSSGIIQQIWGQDLYLEFIGKNIPHGVIVTLQTTQEGFFAHEPFQPTNCSKISHLIGASRPFHLNVSTHRYKDKLCNGTCDLAHLVVPATLPLVRGARYSLCFFPPFPYANPKQQDEYANDWLPGLSIEFIQKREEYLTDVCTRHRHSVDLFYGNGWDDTDRDRVSPFYFDTPFQH